MKAISKNICAFSKTLGLSLSLMFGCSHLVYSQQNNNPINSLTMAINNLVAGYGVDQLQGTPTSLFTQSSDAVYNLLVGEVVNAIIPPNNSGPIAENPNYKQGSNSTATSPTLTGQAVYNLLMTTNPNDVIATAAKVPAPLPISVPNPSLNIVAGNNQQPSPLNTQAFDMATLLGPLQYDEKNSKDMDDSKSATNFILFSSGMVNPPQVLDLTRFNATQLSGILNNALVQQYLISLRSLVAQKSVGLNNLYQLYAERIPVSTQKLAQSVPEIRNTKLYPEASPMKIDQYMATRRFSDPNWESMIQKKATPAELMRQEIYLLREIRYELYQGRVQNERVLATLSVMELQNTATQQIFLQQLYSKIISQPPFAPSSK
jgi:hypothetical protein